MMGMAEADPPASRSSDWEVVTVCFLLRQQDNKEDL